MIWIALRAFAGRLWTGVERLAGLVGRYPLHAALVASLCLSGWLWRGWNGAIAERDAIRLDLDAIKAAQIEAGRQAKIAREAQEARFRALAERKDNEAAQLRADYAALADRYIRANRLRPQAAAGAAGGAAAAASGDSAGVPDGAGGAPELVAVTADDVRICTENTAKLEAAQGWAAGLNAP